MLHAEFEAFLQNVTPCKQVLNMFRAMVTNTWQTVNRERNLLIEKKERQKFELNDKIEKFIDLITTTDNATLRKRLESDIEKHQKTLDVLQEELVELRNIPMTREDSVRTVFEFFENPYRLWSLGTLEDKKLVLQLVFARSVEFDKKQGFRTASLSLPFRLSKGVDKGDSEMVVCTRLAARRAVSSFPSKCRFTGIFREITANLAQIR